jgi:hypothetical protein
MRMVQIMSVMEELLLNLAFLPLLMLSYDMGKDLKMEFIQRWAAMAVAAVMVLMGRRSG